MKSILIVGLGKLGTYMARKFADLGNQVLVLDKNEEKINEILPEVTVAQIGDATKPSVLESIGVDNFDLCVVSIIDNFQSSLQATSLLKEAGAKYVLSCASTEIQEKFLLRNGADEVVFAEKSVAERIAVMFSANNIFDYVQLTPDYSIYEIPTPKSWAGKTIREKDVRSKYSINILAVKRDGEITPLPSADHLFDTEERTYSGLQDDYTAIDHGQLLFAGRGIGYSSEEEVGHTLTVFTPNYGAQNVSLSCSEIATRTFTFSLDGASEERAIPVASVNASVTSNGSNGGPSHTVYYAQKGSDSDNPYYCMPIQIEKPFGFGIGTMTLSLTEAVHARTE